jgi:glutathione S-transferase
MTTPITVHHLGVSQSERVVWVCEELGVDYRLVIYARDPVTRMAPPEYKALHPMGTAPVLTDGETTFGESGAIVEYIVAKYGKGRLAVAADAANFADYLFWLHFANGSLITTEMMVMVTAMAGAPDNPMLAMINDRAERAYDLIEKRLGEVPYFAGDELTAADIMMVFTLTTMRAFSPRDHSRRPNILAYLQRIAARPAYQRAMAKGDPGMEPLLT